MTEGQVCANSGLSPSVLAPSQGLSLGFRLDTGSLGQVGRFYVPATTWAAALIFNRNVNQPHVTAKTKASGPFLSDVPAGCPKGLSSDDQLICRDAQKRADKLVGTLIEFV